MKKTENYDPYETRVISPKNPRCVVTGDPGDQRPEIIHENKALWEKGEEKNGTSENSL